MRFGLPRKRTRQPSQLAQIDWSNPLTQGLVFASSMGMPQDATFATATTQVNAGVKFGAGSGGVGILPNANTAGLDFGTRDASNVTSAITCLAFGIQATTGADASAITKCATNGGTNTPFDFGTVNGGQLRFGRANSAYRVWKGVASVGNTASRVSAVSQGVDIAVAPKFYIDGVFDTGAPTSIYSGVGVGAAIGNTVAVRALNRGDATTPYQGTLYLALVWNRELSAAEHAALGVNPWQIFRSQRAIYALPNGGTTGVSGSFDSTLSGVTLASSGAVTNAGAFASTLGGATMSASGVIGSAPSGAFASTLAGMTMIASGSLLNAGSFASTLAGASMSASGNVASAVTGTFASTLGGVTMAAYETAPPAGGSGGTRRKTPRRFTSN